jgi:4-carboxymuconolactone decarboxylase
MPRLPYPDPTSLAEAERERFAREVNVRRMILGASPAVAASFSGFTQAFFTGSALPGRLREIAILRVGHLSQSRYEVFQHEALARRLGMSDAELGAIRQGGPAAAALGSEGAAVLAFTDDVVRNVRAGDDTLAAVRGFLDDRQVLDLILVIGCYMLVSRFLETTGVELDAAPLDWSQVVGE